MGALTQLTHLDLSFNQLSGTLPTAWSALSVLTALNLQGNTLRSTIPSAWASGMADAVSLVLANNPSLCGTVPAGETDGAPLEHCACMPNATGSAACAACLAALQPVRRQSQLWVAG